MTDALPCSPVNGSLMYECGRGPWPDSCERSGFQGRYQNVHWDTGAPRFPGKTEDRRGTMQGLISDNPRIKFATVYSSLVGVNSLCVSQLLACRLCVLLGPVIATHTPPAWARTVHLQDMASWRETHWRDGWHREEEKRSRIIFPGFVFAMTKGDRVKCLFYLDR